MYDEIIKELETIEEEENVKILYAVESGSRAWGFASENSDYDIRGFYVHPPNWYLSINDKRDVIEKTVGDIDISVWDLKKTLGLMKKSNPALYEWSRSKDLYIDSYWSDLVFSEFNTYYSQMRIAYHYHHMARGNFEKYLDKDIVKVKKYLYVIRPLLALIWLKSGDKPPLHIDDILYYQDVGHEVYHAIDNLVERKRNGEELEESEKIPILDKWIKQELSDSELLVPLMHDPKTDYSRLNEIFRMIVFGINW